MAFTKPQLEELVGLKADYDKVKALLEKINSYSDENFTFELAVTNNANKVLSSEVINTFGFPNIQEIYSVVKAIMVAKANARMNELRAEMLELGFDINLTS